MKQGFIRIALMAICAILMFALFSCSPEKRLAKAVKKHGPKEVAAHIITFYPEYIGTDTVRVDTIIEKVVEVLVPEIRHDTVIEVKIEKEGIARFDYNDSKLWIKIRVVNGKANLEYLVKERTVKDTVHVPVTVKVPCHCPTKEMVDHLRTELIREKAEKKGMKRWGWQSRLLLLLIAIAGIAFSLILLRTQK
jgi:hypothetical protein